MCHTGRDMKHALVTAANLAYEALHLVVLCCREDRLRNATYEMITLV